MLKNRLLLLFLLFSPILFAQNTDSLLSSVFSANVLDPTNNKNYSFTKVYRPNTSTWAISEVFSDSIVFQAEMKYRHPEDSSKSYQMRIGKGGQIYSLHSAFGESIPPQYRKPKRVGGKLQVNASAPWIDEVWQMVAVDTKQNNRKIDEKYFIHQAGVYLNNADQKMPFYSPLLAEFHDAKTQSYRVVNWGQQAHTADNITAKYTSDILYYTSYTNLGNGIIQVDGMIYNFGKDQIDHINMPWGGVRISSLEHFFVSNRDGTYSEKVDRFASETAKGSLAKTDGWMIYSSDKAGKAPAFGMVFGKDEKKNKVDFRYGHAGQQKENNPRDYNVFAITRRFKDHPISFGKSARFRYFYVVGATTEAVKNTILQNKLNTLIIEDTDTPKKEEVAEVHYQLTKNKGPLQVSPTDSPKDALTLRAQPYADSYPLFFMKSSDGRRMITCNQYYFSDLPYDGQLQEMKLLGFADEPYELFIPTVADAPKTETKIIEPTWESMAENYQIPEWFQDGKIGVWMHWGISSAIDETRPRDGSHYGRWMYGSESLMPPAKNDRVATAVDRLMTWHIEKFGPLSAFGYEKFIKNFKAENFDADAIVKFAKKCGARFIMPVATHHDNFDMYDSSHPWNAVDMGPKRDVLQEWKDAAKKHGLKFGVSTHLYWSPGFFNGARKHQTVGAPEWSLFNMDYDPRNFASQDTWNEHWYQRSWELIDKYDPDMFNNDSPYPLIGDKKGKGLGVKLFSEFINRDLKENNGQQTTVLSFKNPKQNKAAFTYNLERGMFGEIQQHPWMWATDLSGNWFYRKNAFTKMSTTVLIGNAIDAISKNGVVMINVALKGDGTLPKNQAKVLEEFGDWVKVNAEGIYNTRPWKIYGEGPLEILSKRGGENLKEYSAQDIRFTQKENILFAFVLAKPTDDISIFTLKEGGLLSEKIKKITLLGSKESIEWSRDTERLRITCPKGLSKLAYPAGRQCILSFKIELK